MKNGLYLVLFFIIMACSSDNTEQPEDNTEAETQDRPNIMLIIADDMGLDATPGYAIGDTKPNMPTLQNMLANGIKFSNLWSYATCTPTRASILTGKYGFRTNVQAVGDALATSELSLQRYLDEQTNNAYDHAVIGKWHLSSDAMHPTTMGVNYYSGLLSGSVQNYFDWNFVQDGATTNSTEYTTTKFADLAIDWMGNTTKPWFLWLAFNAPHTPFHFPDSSLHSQGNLPTDEASIAANPLPYYMAMMEAMDTELGRVIASMSQEEKDNTIFIFIGDNGSPGGVAQGYNSRRVKGSIYQGGINVPLIVSGKGVNRFGTTENALINTTDLFATIAALAGVSVDEINDSQSFKGLLTNENAVEREYVFAENTNRTTNGMDYAVRNRTHKYIRFDDGTEALYEIENQFIENPNLLSANQLPLSDANAAIKVELETALEEILP